MSELERQSERVCQGAIEPIEQTGIVKMPAEDQRRTEGREPRASAQ